MSLSSPVYSFTPFALRGQTEPTYAGVGDYTEGYTSFLVWGSSGNAYWSALNIFVLRWNGLEKLLISRAGSEHKRARAGNGEVGG